MRTAIFQVDAFAARRFSGNPAAVMALTHFPDPLLMQAIAAENNLAETAFIVPTGGNYRIRWFTPTTEVPLCGHATLASAAVVMERLEPARTQIVFYSASGPLTVRRLASGYVMDFPARTSRPVLPPPGLAEALGAPTVEVVADEFNYLARMKSAHVVREVSPNFSAIASLDRSGVIITAAGDRGYDFTSRYFARPRAYPKIRSPAVRIAHWRPTGRRGLVRANFVRIRLLVAVGRSSAESAVTESSSRALASSILKVKWRFNVLLGSCHCGAVKFRVDNPISELTTCDCSLCSQRNALIRFPCVQRRAPT